MNDDLASPISSGSLDPLGMRMSSLAQALLFPVRAVRMFPSILPLSILMSSLQSLHLFELPIY